MLENILTLKNDFDLFLLDIYGVIWDGKALYPNVENHLLELKKLDKHIVLLSNGAERAEDLEKVQERRGLLKGVHYDKIVSSGELAYQCFCDDNRDLKYFFCGRPAKELFEGSPYREAKSSKDADFIYLGVPQVLKNDKWENVFDITPFEAELKNFLEQDKVLICANPDLRAVTGSSPTPVIRQGSLARYYQDIGGEVEFFGKPYPDVFALALEDYDDIDFERILMVGDTLESDILGANSLEIKTALSICGMSHINMLEEGQFDNIDEYCEDLQIIPTYKLKTF